MSSTIYLILAELTVLLHFLFVAFVTVGALLLLRWPKLIWLHLPALFWGIYIQFSGGYCPLTPLEKTFRQLADIETYEGGFINHYLIPIIYPPGLTHEMQIMIGIGLIVLNIVIYSLFIYRQRHRGTS
ncbi:MAG: DUF2784 domain-containing protein [Thiohalophilus sp.]|uniref:DUF2784 domain-containing protein n=1 Tax=Thiohalophilus sp. TaxID=3028392 RepID=UPI002870869E|nr:DUF2784 domain-containing protein [Thiohalophilus sp.]MDR9435332.1 DUF2784 domain-containing protein [Thiohalophilus sp.]